MKVTPERLAALSRLFSSGVVRQLASKGRSPMFTQLAREGELEDLCGPADTVGFFFEKAFRLLRTSGRRDEYIYRSALIQKILLGKHSLRTASVVNEIRAGSSKADLVILNGTATVYEIKSERDSLARLQGQIDNYLKVFASVNVIAGEGHIDAVSAALPQEVGVLRLSDRYSISTVREAQIAPERICPATLYGSLRTAEASEILRALGATLPNLPNTQVYGALREIFVTQDPAKLHAEMVRVLKRTRSLASLSELVDSLPKSLHAAALSVPIPKSDYLRFIGAVGTPFGAAMQWA